LLREKGDKIMEFLDIIKKRRSIRFYTSRSIDEGSVKKLVEAARWAPSGHRIYSRRIVVVQRAEVIDRIKAVSPGLHGNPTALIVLCRDKNRMQEVIHNWIPIGKESEDSLKMIPEGHIREEHIRNDVELLSVMDVAISAQNICLEATALGIGSCMIGQFDRSAVRGLLDLPENVVPGLLVSLGYPDKSADARFQRSIPKLQMKRSVKDILIAWIK
jgi:nitroreductase